MRWDEKEKKEEAVIGCVLAECEEEICRHLPAQSDNQFRRIRNQFKRVLAATKANINTNILQGKHKYILVESRSWRDRNLKFGPQIVIWRCLIWKKIKNLAWLRLANFFIFSKLSTSRSQFGPNFKFRSRQLLLSTKIITITSF